MNHSILQMLQGMVLYKHKEQVNIHRPIPMEEGSKDGLSKNFRRHSKKVKENKELKRKQFRTNRKNRQICRKRRLRKMMEPAHYGNNP